MLLWGGGVRILRTPRMDSTQRPGAQREWPARSSNRSLAGPQYYSGLALELDRCLFATCTGLHSTLQAQRLGTSSRPRDVARRCPGSTGYALTARLATAWRKSSARYSNTCIITRSNVGWWRRRATGRGRAGSGAQRSRWPDLSVPGSAPCSGSQNSSGFASLTFASPTITSSLLRSLPGNGQFRLVALSPTLEPALRSSPYKGYDIKIYAKVLLWLPTGSLLVGVNAVVFKHGPAPTAIATGHQVYRAYVINPAQRRVELLDRRAVAAKYSIELERQDW